MIYNFDCRGAVANILVTSCMDNICRIWSETILPEDGVVSMTQLDPSAAQDTKFRTHRQKARFVQRFRHMRQSFSARRVVKGSFKSSNPDPVASLPSTYSVHEFHNYGFQGTGISPGLHFHLSGTIMLNRLLSSSGSTMVTPFFNFLLLIGVGT